MNYQKMSLDQLIREIDDERLAIAINSKISGLRVELDRVPDHQIGGTPITPKVNALVQRISRLNPNAGEIGAGMLNTIVDQARDIMEEIEIPDKEERGL